MPYTDQPDHDGLSQVCNILSASPLAEDHDALERILRCTDPDTSTNFQWQLSNASTLISASRMLRQVPCAVILCERDLPAGGWKELLEHTRLLTSPPLIIVTSLHADDFLWAEALNLGASDVLGKPFDRIEVTRVITSTYLRWCHESAQREGGNLLRRGVGGN